MKRTSGTLLVGGSVWLVGLTCVFSFNIWADITFFGKTFFDLFSYTADTFLLPISGLLIAVFSGWVLKRSTLMRELDMSVAGFNLWRFAVRLIVPVAVITIVYSAVTA